MQLKLKPLLAPVLLFLLGSISILFGAWQMSLLHQGAAGAQNEMASGHYFLMPIPIVVHIVAGSFFNLLMPLQFVSPIREGFPRLHRYMGRFLVLCALGYGLSALWMNSAYPQYGGSAKFWGIWAHCVVLIGSLVLGLIAIRQNRPEHHRAWMMRMTAAALSPATQRLFFVPSVVVFGESIVTDAVIGGVIWFGLIVNLVFVECFLLRTFWGSRPRYQEGVAAKSV